MKNSHVCNQKAWNLKTLNRKENDQIYTKEGKTQTKNLGQKVEATSV